MTEMLAVRFHEYGPASGLKLEEVDRPAPGPGEVLLQLGAAGICGSDLHYYFEGRNGNFVVREPLIPGHEASAVVAAIGDAVTRVKVGDADAAYAAAPHKVDARYETPPQHHNPMELFQVICAWDGDYLTVWESTQHVIGTQRGIAKQLRISPKRVRVIGISAAYARTRLLPSGESGG